MLVRSYDTVLSQVFLYFLNGNIVLDCARIEECTKVVEAFRDGTLWFRDNHFGINHTGWMTDFKGTPMVAVLFSQAVPFHFVPDELRKDFIDVDPDDKLLRYNLGADGTLVRGANEAIHNVWFDTFTGKNGLEDTDPTDPEELEVEQDIVLGYPISVHGCGPSAGQGEVVTITQDFANWTKPDTQKKYVHFEVGINPEVRTTEPDDQKFTMGDLFKRSMDAANVHTAQLKDVYGDQWPKVHNVIYLAKRYTAMMQVDSRVDFDEHRFGQKTSRNHIRWMIQELHDNMEQSLTKKNRWLGFIQGLMIAYGYTTVDREREETRDMFNGD